MFNYLFILIQLFQNLLKLNNENLLSTTWSFILIIVTNKKCIVKLFCNISQNILIRIENNDFNFYISFILN